MSFSTNRLALNVDKANYIMFTNCVINSNSHITIDNKNIDRLYISTYLRLLIDHKLNWNKRVTKIQTHVLRNIAVLHRARQVLDNSSLFMLYCTLRLFMYHTNMKCGALFVFVLQNNVIRIICNETFMLY